mmetsp:Transcript_23427/g.52247  ORF Transcript_23427/g.52247 Transcript_23427/m.52247 type:complete len:232 (+) Transcript_23427:465-1160(+)
MSLAKMPRPARLTRRLDSIPSASTGFAPSGRNSLRTARTLLDCQRMLWWWMMAERGRCHGGLCRMETSCYSPRRTQKSEKASTYAAACRRSSRLSPLRVKKSQRWRFTLSITCPRRLSACCRSLDNLRNGSRRITRDGRGEMQRLKDARVQVPGGAKVQTSSRGIISMTSKKTSASSHSSPPTARRRGRNPSKVTIRDRPPSLRGREARSEMRLAVKRAPRSATRPGDGAS